MTALAGVASYLPSTRVPISALVEEPHLPRIQATMFERFYGLSHVRRAPGQDWGDLMTSAVAGLTELRGREDAVRYVIQARTMPWVTPYPITPLDDVCRELGIGDAVSFALTQHACASGLLAVDLAGRLLAADEPGSLALVLVGEKAFTPSAMVIPRTTVMGEGSAAVLVEADGPRDRMLGYATRTHGRYHAGFALSERDAAEFKVIYPDALAEVLTAAVDQAGVAMSDLALLLPHNVNSVSWERVAKEIGFPVERVYLDNVPDTGHCFCADSFINYRSALDGGRLQPGDRYLMAAVGLGATFSAMVFEH